MLPSSRLFNFKIMPIGLNPIPIGLFVSFFLTTFTAEFIDRISRVFTRYTRHFETGNSDHLLRPKNLAHIPGGPVWNREPITTEPAWNRELIPEEPVRTQAPIPSGPAWNREPTMGGPVPSRYQRCTLWN
jgi:hypothetical protein